ncbi:Nucleic acid-binding proteins superfamily [Zea mays]|uniref:Nucleic acid-binding proteins superfamily n=1 Tax=Zea mays TaxID=4577 RepID=A0A1D6EBK2_MAIZE|nr:Nucleic acid-binding proteins superfamily [Zea mays]
MVTHATSPDRCGTPAPTASMRRRKFLLEPIIEGPDICQIDGCSVKLEYKRRQVKYGLCDSTLLTYSTISA